ncbi:MAG: hypothetical protein WCS65_16120 [Verrucomicrobiae bacterium]
MSGSLKTEPLSEEEARRVADALWPIDWTDGTQGWMECPGKSLHTKQDGGRDCRVMLDGGKPPTVHCLHASCAGAVDAANFALRSALGKAESEKGRGRGGWVPDKNWKPHVPKVVEEPPAYDAAKLEAFAAEYARVVDVVWLANRSVLDPSRVTSAGFLDSLYHKDRGEKVLVFTTEHSQGEAVWPADPLPDRGREGVWFLAQPVCGEYLPNPRSVPEGKPSRRIMECVLSWRYMLLESDEAPMRLWLGAVAQLPLRVAAIYTSGSRSIHVLVQVDAPVREVWDREKAALMRGMVTLGACRGSLSSVRLSRLPGCLRLGKSVEIEEGDQKRRKYVPFDKPGQQKLLYLAPDPAARSMASLVPRRDVVGQIQEEALALSKRKSVTLEELAEFERRAAYFAPASDVCKAVAADAAEMMRFLKDKK